MCGIAGAIDLVERRTFPVERLRAMTGALVHRGPDDEHVHVEPGLALGARRLSIIDLPGGRQPLANETDDIWVAFNGELFDYPELRRRLLAAGHRLATHCDTEAWVHLYEDFGTGLFDRAQGQFAVSLWDRRRRSLLLGRDRIGICPLFYAQCDGWLLWASEVKAILSSGMIAAKPDLQAINHFFTFLCAGTTRSYFEGIRSIPPGHYLNVHDGRVTLRQYWDLDFPEEGAERHYDDSRDASAELEQVLRRAFRRRLRSDVPVVSYISGGLDSTVVLGMSSQERGDPLHSFTIGLDRAGPDERSRASQSAALLHSPLTTVTLNRDDIACAFPELILAAEGPVLDTSCAALMRLSEGVHAQGYKVALTGEGADEALAGYVWFKSQAIGNGFARRFGRRLPDLLHRATLASIGGDGRHRPVRAAMAGVRTVQQDIAEMTAQCRESLFTPGLWERLDGHCPYDDLDLTNERIARWHPLNQSLYVGYKIMLPGLLMTAKGDRVAMHNSVETRYPFLDEDVVDFCAGLDPAYKLRRLSDKWLLRRVAERILPPAIAKRRKTMFRATLSKTFLGDSRPAWVDQVLSPESLRATGYFQADAVAAARKMQARKRRLTPRRAFLDIGLTAVIATQLWHHVYCGGGLAELPTFRAPPPARGDAAVRLGTVLTGPVHVPI